VSFVKS